MMIKFTYLLCLTVSLRPIATKFDRINQGQITNACSSTDPYW